MFKGNGPIESPHLTKRALDAGESARFQAFSLPQLFSQWTAFRRPRPSASNARRWAARAQIMYLS